MVLKKGQTFSNLFLKLYTSFEKKNVSFKSSSITVARWMKPGRHQPATLKTAKTCLETFYDVQKVFFSGADFGTSHQNSIFLDFT